MPFNDTTATSEVPPPMSSTMEPRASCTGKPAPDRGRHGLRHDVHPARAGPSADSLMARRSTWVEPNGTHTSTRGLGRNKRSPCTLLMKYCSIFSVYVKSAMTPSFMGRTAVMCAGRSSQHLLGIRSDGDHDLPAATRFVLHGDDGGFVEHDAA